MRSHLPGQKEAKQPFFEMSPPTAGGDTSMVRSQGGEETTVVEDTDVPCKGRDPMNLTVTHTDVQNFLIIDFKSTLQNHLACLGIIPPKLVYRPPAGRLVHYQQNWLKITQDRVLNTIQGYLIDFSSMPHQPVTPHPPQYSAEQTHLISEEVTELLQKGAIGEIVQVKQPGFYSNLFLDPK